MSARFDAVWVMVAGLALVAGPAMAEVVDVGPAGAIEEVDAPRSTFTPPARAWSRGGKGTSDFPGWARATGYDARRGARVGKRTVKGHRGTFESDRIRVFAEKRCVPPTAMPVWKRVADIVADEAVVMKRPVVMGEGVYRAYDVYTKGRGLHRDRIVPGDDAMGPVPIVGVEMPDEFIDRPCGALDSHLVHFDPTRDGEKGEAWIDFDGPIVAVMLYGNRLDGSDAIFGLDAVTYQADFVDDRGRAGRDGMADPVPWRGVELGRVAGLGPHAVEQVEVAPDAKGRPNRRLAVTLYGDPAGDQIRVLTRSTCGCER